MRIIQLDNLWAITHAGRVIAKRFTSYDEADRWADYNIDDQVFDGPNTLMSPLEYEPDLIVRKVPKGTPGAQ